MNNENELNGHNSPKFISRRKYDVKNPAAPFAGTRPVANISLEAHETASNGLPASNMGTQSSNKKQALSKPSQPFAEDVRRERPADIVANERRAQQVELIKLFEELARITHYKRKLTLNIRNKLKRAVNDYGYDNLVKMADYYMSPESYWGQDENRAHSRRFMHFLQDSVLDSLDAGLSNNNWHRRPTLADFDQTKLTPSQINLRTSLMHAAEQLKAYEVFELDVNDPDWVEKAGAIMDSAREKLYGRGGDE